LVCIKGIRRGVCEFLTYQHREFGMVSKKDIEKITQQIVDYFHLDRVILFGSYAYGNPRADSDVDLLVLLPYEGKGFKKSLEIINN
jgi:predicted nucleotidyltransferase